MDDYKSEPYGTPLPYFLSELERKRRQLMRADYASRSVLCVREKAHDDDEEEFIFKFFTTLRQDILLERMTHVLVDRSDLATVIVETADVLKTATKSRVSTVFMVDESADEIYQVTRTMADKTHRICFAVGPGTTVSAHCAYEKENLKIDDFIMDGRFPDGLGHGEEIKVRSVLCVPILTKDNECVAILEFYRGIGDKYYSSEDLRLVVVTAAWIGSTIYEHQRRDTLQKQYELNRSLLNFTKSYFADMVELDSLITELINFAKQSVQAEHAVFLILSPTRDDLFAEVYEEGLDEDDDKFFKKNYKIKLDSNNRLLHMVAETGTMFNIRNAQQDPRVVQDAQLSYIIQSMIIVPIVGQDEILGIIQLMNKRYENSFTKSDEILLHTFSIYCSFILCYSRLHKIMMSTHNLNLTYMDMIKHHMEPCVHDYSHLLNNAELSALPPRFANFDFHPSETCEAYMPQLVVHMFTEIAKDFFPNPDIMTRFVLIIQKSYVNENPFHTFQHGFSVCHCMYNILKRNMALFTPLEMKAMMVATYGHDIHHYGFQNNFLAITNHYLAQLYEVSTRETHAYYTVMFIIKHLGVFDNLSKDEFKQMQSEIRVALLALDFEVYFKRRGMLYRIVNESLFNWNDYKHRGLLKSIMMNICDFSGFCKPFAISRKITHALYQQYYFEGDRERELDLIPLDIMDRTKAPTIADDQIEYISLFVLPGTLLLRKLLPNCAALFKEALRLRDAWQQILETEGQKLWDPTATSPSPSFDDTT